MMSIVFDLISMLIVRKKLVLFSRDALLLHAESLFYLITTKLNRQALVRASFAQQDTIQIPQVWDFNVLGSLKQDHWKMALFTNKCHPSIYF